MLTIHRIANGTLECVDASGIDPESEGMYWLDLRDPDRGDRERMARARRIHLPAIEDVSEIESSSRFFVDADGLHLRIWFIDEADGELLRHPAAFVLSENCLISLTWGRVECFESLRSDCTLDPMDDTPAAVLLKLLELHLDGLADRLEAVYDEIDSYWKCPERPSQQYLESQLGRICCLEANKHRIRFALMDLQHVLAGLDREDGMPVQAARRFAAVRRDVDSLIMHSDFISEKLDFLMNMLVSRINLIDNRVGKILSVVALVFLPPMLIAGVYGMNFHDMPGLAVPWAYPVAVLVMVASAVLPYLVFKWKRWL